jgi:hypothetical protein
MTLHTAIEGIGKGLTVTLLDMQHSVFCLLLGLVLLALRKKPRDAWFYILALLPGYLLERLHPMPPMLVNAFVALTLVFALLQQWMYEKMAPYTVPFLLFAGLFHGLSMSFAVAGSATPLFLAFTLTATLVQAAIIYGFGAFCYRISIKSPDGFEGLENIVGALGTGVAMAYLFWAF